MAVTVENLTAPTFTVTKKGMTAEWRQRIPTWGDVQSYMEEKMGVSEITGDDRKIFNDVRFPGKDWLYLNEMTIGPFSENRANTDDSDGVPTSDQGALAVLKYSTQEYDTKKNQDSGDDPDRPKGKDGTFQTHRLNASVRKITHAQASVKWEKVGAGGETTVPPDARPGFPEVIVEHEITWHEVPAPPFTALYTLLGKCNDAKFWDHAAETVLFSHLSGNRQSNMDGSRKWEMVLRLDVRIIQSGGAQDSGAAVTPGWNHFLQPNPLANNEWVRIVNDTGNKLIPTADFTALLKFT